MTLGTQYVRTALVLTVAIAAGACSASSTAPAGGGSTGPPAATAADLAFCVSESNRYRAMVGAPPLAESAALETYAAAGAQQDGTARAAHQHFVQTNGGGIATAENELPWWPINTFGSVHNVMAEGISGFFGEGPTGDHYRNLTNRSYTLVGCGVFANGSEVTVTQDFR